MANFMRVSFVAVTEQSPKFLNMLKLLLYSFRKNAGIYKDSTFTIVTNGDALPEPELSSIYERFAPIHIRTMPRLGGNPFNNKFNAFYAVDESTYDVMVYIDCDVVVLGALDEITKSIDIEKSCFKAIAATHKSEVFEGYDSLIQYYGNVTKNELESYRSQEFVTKYPLFNAGVLVMSKKAVLAIRNDALCISYELYKGRFRTTLNDYIRFELYKKFKDFNQQNALWFKKIVTKSVMPTASFDYPAWLTEQLGLALAVIKNNAEINILDKKYNWTREELMPDGSFPAMFHYLKGRYKIDRDHLFNGDWIQEYLNSSSPLKQALANLVNCYNDDFYKSNHHSF